MRVVFLLEVYHLDKQRKFGKFKQLRHREKEGWDLVFEITKINKVKEGRDGKNSVSEDHRQSLGKGAS